MGDHRGVSLDKPLLGLHSTGKYSGQPMFIYWSFETPEDQYLKTGAARSRGFYGACGAALF